MGSTPAGRNCFGRVGAPRRPDAPAGRPYHFRDAKISFLPQRFEPVEQIFFACDSDDLVAQLAVLEKEQSRDRSDVVLERETLIFIHVHFRYLDRARFFARDFIQHRRDHLAWAAPFRPEIDDHGLVSLRHFTVKIGFIEFDNSGIFHGLRKVSPNLNN